MSKTVVVGWAIKSAWSPPGHYRKYAHPGTDQWGERYVWPTLAEARVAMRLRAIVGAKIVRIVRRAPDTFFIVRAKNPRVYKTRFEAAEAVGVGIHLMEIVEAKGKAKMFHWDPTNPRLVRAKDGGR